MVLSHVDEAVQARMVDHSLALPDLRLVHKAVGARDTSTAPGERPPA